MLERFKKFINKVTGSYRNDVKSEIEIDLKISNG